MEFPEYLSRFLLPEQKYPSSHYSVVSIKIELVLVGYLNKRKLNSEEKRYRIEIVFGVGIGGTVRNIVGEGFFFVLEIREFEVVVVNVFKIVVAELLHYECC